MATEGGTIRIKPKQWELLTQYAVNCSVQLARPINQATVLNAVLLDQMNDFTKRGVVEMVKVYVGVDS